MIIDKIDNVHLYFGINSKLVRVVEYLNKTDFSIMNPGKYNIDDENIFLLINQYQTKNESECTLESHQKYIDFQYILSGNELIGYTSKNDQSIIKEYDPDQDYSLFKSEKLSFFNLASGSFAIFLPDDLHMPGIMIDKIENIKKIVIKILI